jgi:S1-C subfamily serine protease
MGALMTLAVLAGADRLGLDRLALSRAAVADDAKETADKVIARSLASSVQLFTEREGGARRSASGVVLSSAADGSTIILTAGHLLAPAVPQTVYVALPGREARIEATILALDVEADIALLEVRDIPATPVEIQTSAHLGDDVWVVSFPWGQRGTVVSGRVSQVRPTETNSFPVEGPVGLIDAAVSYGTSGGGVFDADSGRLVGIVRGYRTAKVTIPGTPAQALEFPIAGETTVVPTSEILCTLEENALMARDGLLAALPAPGQTCPAT